MTGADAAETRVLCYGAGAVGSLVAARLAHAGGVSVTVLARRAHVAAIRTWGLALSAPDGRYVCKNVDSVTSLDDLAAPPDLAVLTVKAYQVPEAVRDLARIPGQVFPVLTLQNGIGAEELVAAEIGAGRTVAGVTTISVTVERAGVVHQHTGGGIALAAVGHGEDVAAIAAAAARVFRGAGFRTQVQPDFRAMKWSKLLLNLLANASAAILGVPAPEVVRDPRLFALERQAFLEAVRVMRGLGLRPVGLPGYPVPLLVAVMHGPEALARAIIAPRVGRGRGEKMPSLWGDLDRGRAESEVAVLNGAVAREGARLGIPTPVNRTLTEVLLALAEGRRDRAEFAGRPEALLAACRQAIG